MAVSRERFAMPAGYGGAWLRRPWAVAGPGRASRRHAERSSQRGRRAGGPPVWRAQEGQAAAAAGYGGAWPRCRWVAAGPGGHSQLQASPDWRPPRGLRGLAAAAVGGGRARAGLEIDHSEPQARVWRSRGRPGPKAPDTQAPLQATSSSHGRQAHGGRTPTPWTASVAGAVGPGGHGRASRSTTPSRRLACGDLAGGPPPTGTHSGQVGRGGPCGMHSAQVRRGGP